MKRRAAWTPLVPGDIVDIIAPASNSTDEKFTAGLEWIAGLGLVPRVPQGMIQTDLFFAAPLKDQWRMLKEALHSDSKAIWCLRGGYGSMRLVPYLEKMKKPPHPKLFIGFSDITSLHLYFNQKWNWPTLHGRTISQLSLEKKMTPDRLQLEKMIMGKIPHVEFKRLTPLNTAAKKSAALTGEIIGGNLRMIQSSLGTAWEVKPKGKILFIEDVSERGYSIDRMLEQMFQAKLIDKNLKALVIGDFTQGLERDGLDLIPQALTRFAARVDYPVVMGLPSGHGHEFNYTVPLNTSCELKTGKVASLKCLVM